MSVGIFTDKHYRPSLQEIENSLGDWKDAWDEFVDYIRAAYAPAEEWKFLYGKKYGWALHFKRSGKMLVNLYPSQGSFTVQINLPEVAIAHARGLGLGEHVLSIIEATHAYPEGRWIFLPLRSGDDIADFKKLLDLRVQSRLDSPVPPKLLRPAAKDEKEG